jgi:predicted MFS family arabinose efflux permease
MPEQRSLNASERRAVVSLAAIFALRMLGLFLLLPVLAVFVRDMPGTTPALAGLALGVYGLSQALLQIPFGYLSDRIGRKKAISAGLLIFALGSVVAALADTIYGVIAGRALQGAGAIAAAVLALAADLTREEQRTKAMAGIGASIGMAFLLALMLAPPLQAWVGVDGIFWLTAALAVCVLPVLWWWTPNPVRGGRRGDVSFNLALFTRILRNAELLRLDIGIFTLHFALTALFVVVPLQLVDALGMPSAEHWRVYVPVLLASIAGMIPMLVLAHRRHLYRGMLAAAIGLIILAEAMFGFNRGSLAVLVIALWLFFVGFNALEAMLPSLISRLAPAGAKGTVLGVYNTFEFLGIFAGGLVGGWLYGAFGGGAVFGLAAAAMAVWLLLVLSSPPPRLLGSMTLRVAGAPADRLPDGLLERLDGLPGVEDSTFIAEERAVYLKIDPGVFDSGRLRTIPELVHD